MQSHRIISGLTILLMVVLVAAGYFLVAQPQLAAASAASAQLVDAQSKISATQAALVSLKSERKKLPALKAELAALQTSVPSSVDGSAYIRGLNDLASAAGVTITALAVSDPQAYVPPIVAAPPAATSATPAPSATPSPVSTTPPTPTGWVPTTDALITGANFVDIPVSITVTGTFDSSLSFIHGLQSGTRLFLVTGIVTKQDDVGSGVTSTITGYIYALTDPVAAAKEAAAEKAAAAAATPTPTPTATPTATTTPSPSGSATPTPTQSPTPTTKP